MIDMNKKYKYRNGEPARILCVDRPGGYYNTVVSMENFGEIHTHKLGTGMVYVGMESPFDPIEVKEEKTLWLNIYPEFRNGCGVCPSLTKEYAEANATATRVARIKITFVEGQFDE